MKQKRAGFSLGTILTFCLTAIVVAGCVFLFGKMRSGSTNISMDTQRVIGALGQFVSGPSEQPIVQTTVRTVTVTLAPVTAPPSTAAPAAAPASTPAPGGVSHTFSLTCAGLLAFQSDISDSVYDKSEKSADYQPIVSGLRGMITADLNLVTLAQTFNVTDRKYDDITALPEAADAIRAMGVDTVLLGNEHILDQAAQGAADTVSLLNGKGLACVGVNAAGAAQSSMVQINGARIAILCYTDNLTAKGKNNLNRQASALQLYSAETARRDIRDARNKGAQCVIVCLNWGKAAATTVTNTQKNTAKALAEMGADVILGTRPTRLLPMEILSVTGEDGKRREAFVAYSLGTLLTESREGFDISGLLLHLTVRIDPQGKIHFDGAEYTPTYIWRQSMNGKMQYRVLCSADPPPEEMSDQQKSVMERALNRVRTAMNNSPVKQR